MRCCVCTKDKLSKEFIPYSITKECNHPRLICLRCATKSATAGKCPFTTCDKTVTSDSKEIKEFNAILNCLFTEIHPTADLIPAVDSSDGTSVIHVVRMTGERDIFPYDPFYSITNLKNKIYNATQIAADKQKLMYGEVELTEYTKEGSKAKLQDFSVKPNTSILLLVVLYNIDERLNDTTFDITWGLPPNNSDYIDSNCFVFSGTQMVCNVAWQGELRTYGNAITHSGDLFDYNKGRPGHQIIKVKLHSIPSNITHLFFVLSSFYSPTLQHFPHQTLRFFDNSAPGKDLCKTTFNHASHSQAVVICSVTRRVKGWQICNSGKLSAGNSMSTGVPKLVETIQKLIREGV